MCRAAEPPPRQSIIYTGKRHQSRKLESPDQYFYCQRKDLCQEEGGRQR